MVVLTESSCARFRQLGGLKPLIDLLSNNDPLIRFNTVGAFPLLTEQTENRTEAFDLGVIQPLVNILANDNNHVVLQNAAQSIGNLADDNSQYQNAARQELLAKVCFACWLICERNEVNQK